MPTIKRFPRHLDIATERQRAYAVFRPPAGKARETWPKTEGKGDHTDFQQLDHGKMAKFVDCDHNP